MITLPTRRSIPVPEEITDQNRCKFVCRDCTTTFTHGRFDDPTSSSGACKCCGSNKWNIIDRETGRILD